MAVNIDVLNGLTDYVYPDILEELRKFNDMGSQMDVINSTSRSLGAGSDESRYQDLFYGMNRLPQIPHLPTFTENQGLIFFTRPELNLSYNNISGVRKLDSFCESEDVNSTAHAIKCALDPITQKQLSRKVSKLIDANNPYITYLTNLCLTMNQPPDIGIDTYTTPEGILREQWMIPDGVVETNGYYDISCVFANIPGNPVPMTIYAWLHYIHHLRFGPCVPHVENRRAGRMDFFTRIERFTLDKSGCIDQFWHSGASLPKNMSLGSFFAYNKLEPTSVDNKQFTVQFGCVGSIANDPIQLAEFNMRMMRWNPKLADGVREREYIKINLMDYGITNYYGYPLIDLNTREMQWWIKREDLGMLLKGQRDAESARIHEERYRENEGRKGRYNPYT